MAMDFDDVLAEVGNFGAYQKKMMVLLVIPTSLLIAFQVSSLLFQMTVPEYWCTVPGHENTTLTHSEWKDLTIPRTKDNSSYETCQQYVMHWTAVNGTSVYTAAENTSECEHGWSHDRSIFQETLATDYNWLCDREKYSMHILSVNTIGSSLSTLIFPLIADRYTGRRVMFFIAVTIHLVCNVAIIFSRPIWLQLFFRFVGGFSFQSNYQMPFIIAIELTAEDRRALASFLSFAAWTFGMCLTALMCWLLPHWQHMVALACVPSVLFLGYWWYLPESPRWLLSKGRIEECREILSKISDDNGKLDIKAADIRKKLEDMELSQGPPVPLKSVLRFPLFRTRLILIILFAGSSFMIYGCLVFNINVMPNNYFMNYFLLSLCELPSNITGWLCVHYLGRRFTSLLTFTVSVFLSLACALVVHNKVLLLTLVGFLKLFSTQGLFVLYLLAAELFPTPLRSSGLGLIAVFGTASIAGVPYIINAGLGDAFQYWLMLALSIVCLLTAVPLPETLGLPLPQTLVEAENLGSDRSGLTWIHHWNKHRYTSLATAVAANDGRRHSGSRKSFSISTSLT